MTIEPGLPGPLRLLVGVWVGETGRRVSARAGESPREEPLRERLVVEPMGCIERNRPALHAVRYRLTSWVLPLEDHALEESGYWIWDQEAEHISLSLATPHGTALLAGGPAPVSCTKLEVAAELGSPTFGICRAPSTTDGPTVLRYEATVDVSKDGSLEYRAIAFKEASEGGDVSRLVRENTLTRVYSSG